ncbi:MAG: DUF4424 family protein [Desulfobacteraceae bacterium]|nr:DUF4424 family protein [Desulfobacteraceae bacterium]
MKGKKDYIGILAALLIAFAYPATEYACEANDSAASLTPEGIRFKKSEEISIEEEILYISPEKIEVTYTFKNHSDKDIITDITFPLPIRDRETPYMGDADFENFIVEVDGRKINYSTEKRAVIANFSYNENKPCYYSHNQSDLKDIKDVTDILKKIKLIDSQANLISLFELTEESFDRLKKKQVPEIVISNLKN